MGLCQLPWKMVVLCLCVHTCSSHFTNFDLKGRGTDSVALLSFTQALLKLFVLLFDFFTSREQVDRSELLQLSGDQTRWVSLTELHEMEHTLPQQQERLIVPQLIMKNEHQRQ
jgi:hypothetical protein